MILCNFSFKVMKVNAASRTLFLKPNKMCSFPQVFTPQAESSSGALVYRLSWDPHQQPNMWVKTPQMFLPPNTKTPAEAPGITSKNKLHHSPEYKFLTHQIQNHSEVAVSYRSGDRLLGNNKISKEKFEFISKDL